MSLDPLGSHPRFVAPGLVRIVPSRLRRSAARILVRLLVISISALSTMAPAGTAGARGRSPSEHQRPYFAMIAWTTHGIPHVRAYDWGSLGYGHGYAIARDNICVLADAYVEASGELSRYHGPDEGRLESDLLWTFVNSDASIRANFEALDADMQSLVRGYAEGYNRYLREATPSGIAAPCRDAEWVRPIDHLDVMRQLNKLTLLAGTDSFVPSIVGAQPPAPIAQAEIPSTNALAATSGTDHGVDRGTESTRRVREGGRSSAPPRSLDEAQRLLARTSLPEFDHRKMGSNAVALGKSLTGGSGALLGNPHFPWRGINRFYGIHLTLPGEYNAMGSAIYGLPLVSIGFNRDIAWSHTVSTARRFVIFELTLTPGDPTAYVVDGETRSMTSETVEVQVLQPDGGLAAVSHTFYSSEWGPMLVIPPLAGWSATTAYTLEDVNVGNTRGLSQYRRMGSARGLDQFVSSLEDGLWLPWVNTIATSRNGEAYYGDISVVPHVTDEKLAACSTSIVAQILSANRVYTLDGSRTECALGSDPDAPVAGIFGASRLPSLRRPDYAQNSNNSYWLANPAEKLEGFPSIIGTDEGKAQGYRTRLGLTQIADRLVGTDGLPGTGFGRRWLENVLFQNRNYSAELGLADMQTLCADDPGPVPLDGGEIVDISEACEVLSGWNGQNDVESVGPHLWREFWNRADDLVDLHAVPFDANDPVNTPRGIALSDATVREGVLVALAEAVRRLETAGLPLDAAWGDVHFDTREDGEIIPIPGGLGGVYNAISAGLVDGVGYTPVVSGSSWIQFVSWRGRRPDARGIVTYSQSTDPESPHFSDLTRLFGQERSIQLPYETWDIFRDPELEFRFLFD
jgi:acyl-homoserine-lactone acylase